MRSRTLLTIFRVYRHAHKGNVLVREFTSANAAISYAYTRRDGGVVVEDTTIEREDGFVFHTAPVVVCAKRGGRACQDCQFIDACRD